MVLALSVLLLLLLLSSLLLYHHYYYHYYYYYYYHYYYYHHFQVVEISTYEDVVFKSSVFGAISCNLYIPPNTISFSKVFSQFDKLLQDSPVVFAVVTTIAVSFLCSLVVAFMLDRRDTKLVRFVIMLERETFQYYQTISSPNNFCAYRSHVTVTTLNVIQMTVNLVQSIVMSICALCFDKDRLTKS